MTRVKCIRETGKDERAAGLECQVGKQTDADGLSCGNVGGQG